jgi:transposase
VLDTEQRKRLVASLDEAGLSEDAKIFILLRAEGLSLRALAKVYGRSAATMGRIEQRLNAPDKDGRVAVFDCTGLDRKVRPSRRLDTRDRRIHTLRASGKSIRAIAAEVGCSVGTVHRVLSPR